METQSAMAHARIELPIRLRSQTPDINEAPNQLLAFMIAAARLTEIPMNESDAKTHGSIGGQ